MKMISLWFLIFAAAAFAPANSCAQDAATQQQLDKLSGQIQDIMTALDVQNKRIDALQQQISDLQDKLNQPAQNNFASADDLKKLAEQVQEIDKKRQDDNQKILDALEKLGKGGNVSTGRHVAPAVSADNSTTDSTATVTPNTPQTGHVYEIKSGDTVAAIAKAYRAAGVKVTTEDILKANPNLNPNSLRVGQKVFIPDPNAK